MIKKTLTALSATAFLVLALSTGASFAGADVIVPTSFTSNLTIGSTGTEVVTLQTNLSALGYLSMPAGVPMGYFGMLTKQAVMRFQTAKGVVPASGYFGPLTRAALQAQLQRNDPVVPMLPGCSVGTIYSITTGLRCDGAVLHSPQPGAATSTPATSTPSKPAPKPTSDNTPTNTTTTAKVDAHGDASATDSTGEYSVSFSVRAFGDDIYVPLKANRMSSTDPSSGGAYYIIEDADGAEVSTGSANAILSRVSGGTITTDGGTSYLRIHEDERATVKLTISFDPATDGFYRAQALSLNYKVGSTGTADRQDRLTPETKFETDPVNIR